jgi:two-component system nitrate/nitrite response regulator NarL
MSVPSPISILIADDHQLVREMIAMVLDGAGDFAVKSVGSLPEALDQIAQDGPFDIVLLDVLMPGMGGLIGVRQAIAANIGAAVVILSGDLRRSFVQEAIALGARGYIPKSLPARSFVEALRQVASGKTFLPLHMTKTEAPPFRQRLVNLSPQEQKVLEYLVDGRSNKEIAREMDLTEVTIKSHMRSLCAKIGARNRTEAALIARNFAKS